MILVRSQHRSKSSLSRCALIVYGYAMSYACFALREAVGVVLACVSSPISTNVVRSYRCSAIVPSPFFKERTYGWPGYPSRAYRIRAQRNVCGAQKKLALQGWSGRPTAAARTSLVIAVRNSSDDPAGEITPHSEKSGENSEKPRDLHAVDPTLAGAARKRVTSNKEGTSVTTMLVKARREVRFDEEGEYRVFRELLEGKKTRFVSRVMYDGTNYRGFQLQPNGRPTVQGVLEAALSRRFQTAVPVVAAGRTDTGVHALGQAIHFDLPNAEENMAQLTHSLNRMMPLDVRVWNMSVAPPRTPSQISKGLPWSSMLNASGKIYSYRLFVGEIPSPLDRLYRAHASHAAKANIYAADVELIKSAISLFVGEHDFAGFSNEKDRRTAIRMADGFSGFNTRRTVYSASVVDEGRGNIRLDFHLDGALYRMVRNMVGALLAIAARRAEPEIINEILRTGVKDPHRIYAAPAHGLTLETVLYDNYS